MVVGEYEHVLEVPDETEAKWTDDVSVDESPDVRWGIHR
jgi:hypothetical protein